MAPSEKSISNAINKAVRDMYNGTGRDELTVNKIRSIVEDELELEGGFLKQGSWKQKSKDVITAEIAKLQEEEANGEPASSQPTPAKTVPAPVKNTKPPPAKKAKTEPSKKTEPPKKAAKRSSDGDRAPPSKRQKKQDAPISDDEDSALTSAEDTPEDSEDSYVSDGPKAKKISKSATKPKEKQPEKEKVDSREADGSADDDDPDSNTGSVNKGQSSDSDSEVAEKGGDDADATKKKVSNDNDSDSDMSVLIDEPPKRKSKPTSTSKSQSKTSSKASKPSKAGSTTLSPDEEMIKTLQSQLTKCGIRKIWGIILKDYGDDTKAKIRHLKGMLKDAGMDGRFSEARAREIKESRELMADLEAVKEGEAKWGMGRGSRSKKGATTKKVVESDDEEDEGSESESEKPPARRVNKARADLAFLGSESESD